MLYKCGKGSRDFLGRFYFYFRVKLASTFKTIIPLAFVGYEMIIANCIQRALVG